MSNIATTIEQSKHLLELGLSPDSADMVYISGAPPHLNVIDDSYIKRDYLDEYDVLAWSLSALLNLIPKGDAQDFILRVENMSHQYKASYYCPVGGYTAKSKDHIEAMVELVCWMLEHGHIKKGGEQ